MATWLVVGALLIREVARKANGASDARSMPWVLIAVLAVFTVLVGVAPAIAEPPPAETAAAGNADR